MAPGGSSAPAARWQQGGSRGSRGRVKSGRLQPAALAPVIPPESRTGRTRSPFCSQELIARSHLGCHSSPDQLPEECEGERAREHGPRPRHQSQGRSACACNQSYQPEFGTPASASPLPCAPLLKGPAPNLGAHFHFQTLCPLFPVRFMAGEDVPTHHRHHLPSTKLPGPSGMLRFVLHSKLAHREGLQGAHKCIWG